MSESEKPLPKHDEDDALEVDHPESEFDQEETESSDQDEQGDALQTGLSEPFVDSENLDDEIDASETSEELASELHDEPPFGISEEELHAAEETEKVETLSHSENVETGDGYYSDPTDEDEHEEEPEDTETGVEPEFDDEGVSHLKDRTLFEKKGKSRIVEIVFIVLGICMVFGVFAYYNSTSTSSSSATQSTSNQSQSANANSEIAQNNDYLRQAEENQSKPIIEDNSSAQNVANQDSPDSSMESPNSTLSDDNQDDSDNGAQQAIKQRMSASTTVYQASMPSTSNDVTAHSNGSVLAGNNNFSKFAKAQGSSFLSVSAQRLQHPYCSIVEGDFIHVTIETVIDSDLPGMIRAVVSRPVYSYLGEHVLIPEGSRLIGQYSSQNSNGESSDRIFVMWDRIITPSGISIMINSPGADAQGAAGFQADSVNTHFWMRMRAAGLMSILGATAATAGTSSSTQPNSANQYQSSIAQAFQQQANQTLQRNVNIKATLKKFQGSSELVFVARDLDFYGLHLPNGACQ